MGVESTSSTNLWYSRNKCDTLRDLVPFVQLKKHKTPAWRSATFGKIAGFSLSKNYYWLHQEGGIKPLILMRKIYETRINFLEIGNTRRENTFRRKSPGWGRRDAGLEGTPWKKHTFSAVLIGRYQPFYEQCFRLIQSCPVLQNTHMIILKVLE